MDTHIFLRSRSKQVTARDAIDSYRLLQIVLGSMVTRCPSMSLAPSALVQLNAACELFAKAADGFGAQKVLVSSTSYWFELG